MLWPGVWCCRVPCAVVCRGSRSRRLNCCWGRTPMFTTSKIVSSFWWVCESLKRLQRVCEPSAASRPSVYGLGLVVMLMVRVWYACADQVCGPAGLVWQILTGIMCSVCGQCQQGPVSLAAAGPWLSACRLVLQGLPMVANSSGVRWQEWGERGANTAMWVAESSVICQ